MPKNIKDPDAFERKVRPIYDALDSRNWKAALKLCQQALQKYPDNDLVRVLKAIGLDRSGRREEANQLVDEVAAGTPTDEQVLRLAAMVLRASGRLANITALYEAAAAAAAKQPGSGGELALVLLHEVFGAHVRESNFVKQQQVALRLSKAVAGASAAAISGERYGWWVVLSLLLQARAALRAAVSGLPAAPGQVPAVALEPGKMLALAEGMMSRQAGKDGRLEGYEALMVYVDVLLAQGKVSEALALVSGPLGAAALRLPSERLQLRAVLTGLTGDLEGAAALLREGLALNPDDWGALLLLLDCMLPGTAVATGSAPGGASPPTFTPQHPLVAISGGLAEQLPPRGAPVPPDGGATEEAFAQAQAVLQLVTLAAEAGAAEAGPDANGGANGVAGGAGGKAVIMRGPDLALVDLAARRHLAAPTDDTESSVIDAILSYFRKYGSLVSCAVDLRTYVARLSDAAAERLAAAVQQEVDDAAAAPAAAAASGSNGPALSLLRRRVCAAQIRDDLGLPRLAGAEEGVGLAGELLELYGTAQPLQEGLDERERGAADELPVLAAAALATSAALAPSDAAAVPYMLAAYGALSHTVTHRPFGAGMRIALSALAALLGAPAASAAHLHKLDVKHVQMDTLGAHLLLPPLLAWSAGGAVGVAAGAAGDTAPLAVGSGGGQQAPHSHQQQLQQQHQAAGSSSHHSRHTLQQAQQQQAEEQRRLGLLQRGLRDTGALFNDHGRDAGETLFTAYNHGMYTKVLEFTAFRERLAAAHTLAVVRAEGAVLDCMQPHGGGGQQGGQGGGGGASSAAGSEGGSGVEAIRTAAAAAASGLKPEEMPAEGRLRFNWDLSTRPTWLPPCAASPGLHVLEWWQSRAKGETRGQGYGRCWWSAASAAEGANPAAARWRCHQTSEAAHRWLLPHCIAGALGAAGPQLLPLRDAVERMRYLLGTCPTAGSSTSSGGGEAGTTSSDAEAATSSSSSTSSAASSPLPGSQQLRQLDVTLYGTALAVQVALAPTGVLASTLASAHPTSTSSGSASTAATAATAPSSSSSSSVVIDADADAAVAALTQLTSALRSAVDTASCSLTSSCQEAAAWGGVLPGGALAALAHLLREPLAVAALCLQAWQAGIKALRKRRTKAGAQLEEAAQRLGTGLAEAEAGVLAAVRACSEALVAAAAAGAAGSDAKAAAAQVVLYLKARGHPACSCSDAAAAALSALVQEQHATLGVMARQAAALAAALS